MRSRLVVLAGAQVVIMLTGESWNLSWWFYHGAMLFGFLVPAGVIGLAFRRGGNLKEVVDGLFLRDTFTTIERSLPETICALIAVIEQKDPYLRGHMRRVAELTVDIAGELDLPIASVRIASHAALLHDVGKLGMPDSVLHKPGRLTEDEFDLLKTHADRGFHMVAQAPSLVSAAPAIRWHHERLDGSGYPDRLRGHEIPIEARIVAVADVWDALTSDRVYRRAMSFEDARDVMLAESGVKLDEQCVRALFQVLDRTAQVPTAAKRTVKTSPERPFPAFHTG